MNRSRAERAAQARARLASEPNVWVATASSEGDPHLVPLSLAWIDDQIIVATPSDTLTARNAQRNGRGRAALDGADEVVIFDVHIDVADFGEASPSLTQRYVERVGWDPRDIPGAWSLLVLTIWRGQAWNGPGEMTGRTIVGEGNWLDD